MTKPTFLSASALDEHKLSCAFARAETLAQVLKQTCSHVVLLFAPTGALIDNVPVDPPATFLSAIGDTRVTLSRLNSINAFDVTGVKCGMWNVELYVVCPMSNF